MHRSQPDLDRLAEKEFTKLIRDLCRRSRPTDIGWAMSGYMEDGIFYIRLRVGGKRTISQASDSMSDALLKVVDVARRELLPNVIIFIDRDAKAAKALGITEKAEV